MGVGVTAAKGFQAVGIHAGLKKQKLDLGILVSKVPASAAGVFTLNRVRAACVDLNEALVQEGNMQAIVVNSGNANACNGPRGMLDSKAMQEFAAEKLELAVGTVAVASTGVIGVPMPMEKIYAGIEEASKQVSEDGSESFAQSILTTDTCIKQHQVTIEIEGKAVTIGGAAKGSGMVHPNMATMLAFMTTDAAVAPSDLQELLRSVTNQSFNMITVDGDTSTNDMVLVMANGMAGTSLLTPAHTEWQVFVDAFQEVAIVLAKAIARDGEGATKLIVAEVRGAATVEDARIFAKSIVGSSLVKTAIYGADANWGRILCAVGYAGVTFDPNLVDIWLGPVQVAQAGQGIVFDETLAQEYLLSDPVCIHVHLNSGDATATAYGCDLTYDYVRINASYRT